MIGLKKSQCKIKIALKNAENSDKAVAKLADCFLAFRFMYDIRFIDIFLYSFIWSTVRTEIYIALKAANFKIAV